MVRISFVALMLLAVTVAAQPTPPSKRLADLHDFQGTWTCTGKALASPWMPEHSKIATIHVNWVLGDYFLNAVWVEKKTASNPHPAAGHVYWGYDEQAKKFVGWAADNFGANGPIESTGWAGDAIVWTGSFTVNGHAINTRDKFVRKGPKQIDHATEADLGGTWTLFNQETCLKKGS